MISVYPSILKRMQPSQKTLANGNSTGLVPDYFVDAIKDVDFQMLRERGVKHLVLDVDHTLAVYRATELNDQTIDFLNMARLNGSVESIFLASNSGRDLSGIAASIHAQVIRSSSVKRKPSKAFFQYVLVSIGCQPHEAAMVGDKLIFDVWGDNRVGMVTILVKPIGPDMLFDRLIFRRFWSRQFLRRSSKNHNRKS